MSAELADQPSEDRVNGPDEVVPQTSWWQSTVSSPRTLTLADVERMIADLHSPERRAAEQAAIRRRNEAYLALHRAAERAGVLEDPTIMVALAHVSQDMPVSPALYERVRTLLGEHA